MGAGLFVANSPRQGRQPNAAAKCDRHPTATATTIPIARAPSRGSVQSGFNEIAPRILSSARFRAKRDLTETS